ncbi:hypothetical protein H0H87_005549 [Tephrocybe sp. NHM501043]|nr:hypothetical protein H0H87_005549 [Tephrocybe sp. NHM501043]
MTEAYTEVHMAIMQANNNINDAMAVILLIQMWNTTNYAEKEVWDRLTEEEEQRSTEKVQAKEEEYVYHAQDKAQFEEAAHSKEMKKHRLKYLVIPSRPLPMILTEVAQKYTVRKLDKGEYMEMWYFTNAGINYAQTHNNMIDSDVLVAHSTDGKMKWAPAVSIKEAKGTYPDHYLTWNNFSVAVSCMLVAFEEAGWMLQQQSMFANLWGQLAVHPYHLSTDLVDTDALLLYQDEQHCAWH